MGILVPTIGVILWFNGVRKLICATMCKKYQRLHMSSYKVRSIYVYMKFENMAQECGTGVLIKQKITYILVKLSKYLLEL